MKDITKLVSGKSHEENLIESFSSLVKKAKSKKEIRQIEMRLLRPKPIEEYKGKMPGKTGFKKRTLLLSFNSAKPIKTWAKYFKVNTYVQNNTYDLDFIIELFRLMEEGEISWDKDNKKFIFDKPKRRIRRRQK